MSSDRPSPPPPAVIGIVVPAYHAERFLAATLQSILDQTVAAWQCVVVNDGSRDGTLAVAERFAARDARFEVVTQENAGMSAARNHGLRRLAPSVRHVVFMDADDRWHPTALEKLRDALDAHPKAVGAHGLGEYIDADGRPVDPGGLAAFGRERVEGAGGRLRPCPVCLPTTFSMVAAVCKIVPPGLLLFRREALDRIGGMDEDLRQVQDFDFYIRLCRLGDLVFVNEVILEYRRHDANQGARPETARWLRRVVHKAFFSPENSPAHRRILRQNWRAMQRHLVAARLGETGEFLRQRRFTPALVGLLRVPFIVYRFARGYPTRRGL